jgi:ribose transport system ATP-binding protein/rhamnose transport system ATP-binding protein
MALVGENGAGKSTLVKILSGIHKPDSGEMLLDGQPLDTSTARKSEGAGIAVVQQEFSLVPTMSVVENVFLGHSDVGRWWMPGQLAKRARPFLELVGLEGLDPRTPVGKLVVAERQLIEIARLLARNAKILILDEPTAALSDSEIERVKRVVRSLSDHEHSIIYVTHRLDEVFQLARRVTVLRNGKSQPPVRIGELTVQTLVSRMIGRPLGEMYPSRATTFGQEVLRVDNLQTKGLRAPVNLSVRSGEILGLAGQLGSGTTPLLQALAGARRVQQGTIQLNGRPVKTQSRRGVIRSGIAYCSGDRKKDGLFAIRPVIETITVPALHTVSPGGWMSRGRELSLARKIAKFFTIDSRRLGSRARNLSGGNQQKVALGKWMSASPKVLMVEEPTIGVDVGARADIYTHLRSLANEGMAVIFASSDIQEVIGLADTIATFHKGRLIGHVAGDKADSATIMRDVTHPPEDESA